MRFSSASAVMAAAALNVGHVSAKTASSCADTDICFQWGVPEASATSSSANVYFQIKAPVKRQWVGLGIGSRMVGAKMFLLYQDGNGNVTLSTRNGANHVEPTFVQHDNVQLLAGTGVIDGMMVANVKCGDGCFGLNLAGSSSWITAWKDGNSLASTSTSAEIDQHDDHANFNVDLSKASITSDSNPFTGSASNSDPGNSSGGGNGGGSGSEPNGAVSSGGNSDANLIRAHGIIMSIVFIAMYPIGAILMPLLGKWYIHAGWQTLAYLIMFAGLGIGYIVSRHLDIFFDNTHTRLGIFVVALMGLQPILGWVHHTQYRKTQKRGVFTFIHVWYGRSLMILGIVNGGLGIQLAVSPKSFKNGYITGASIAFLLYVGAIGYGLVKSKRRPTKRLDSPSHSGVETRDVHA